MGRLPENPSDEASGQSAEAANLKEQIRALNKQVDLLQEELSRLHMHRLGSGDAQGSLGTALAEREAIVAEVERLAHVGTWVWDVQTNEVSWSHELYRILGYEPNLPPSVELFFAALHPDDRDEVRARSQRSATTGATEPGSLCRVVHRNGSIRHVQLIGSSLRNDSGEILRLVGGALDVTAFVMREAELRRTADLLNQAQGLARLGSFIWHLDEARYEWSDTLHELFGIPRTAAFGPEAFLERIHPEDRERVRALVHGLPMLKQLGIVPFRLTRADAGVHHVSLTARFEPRGNGSSARVIGTLQDVTQWRELEEQLRHSQKMEAVGSLAGGVAHDFNNYLVVIRGNLELLAASAERADDRELINEAANASDRCATLTRQLLAFGRKNASQARVVDLAELVRESAKLLRRLLGEHIELEVEAAAGTGGVLADPANLELVLMNLAINARDAMPRGGRLSVTVAERELTPVFVRTRPGLSPGRHLVLQVRDTGLGVPEPLKTRIFEPFFTTKGPGRGTGLGLATVYAIVSQCRGHIEFESDASHGTTFALFFPREELPSTSPEPQRSNMPAGSGESILLVEDEHAVRRLTRRLLERGGYRVFDAEDGVAALAAAASLPNLDLLLTDITMPRLDGVALAEALRAKNPRLKVLLMSGYPTTESVGRAPSELRHSLLPKPFTQEQLLTRVRTALDEAI